MRIILLSAAIAIMTALGSPGDFISDQKKFDRVRKAYAEKESKIVAMLKPLNIKKEELNILIVNHKHEKEMVIYAKRKSDLKYSLLATYDVCALSGEPGPKRKQGDGQVPEGFYFIDRFNPSSNYHLSLGVSYPNQSDKLSSTYANLGGDIFIHGSCVTIGCMPMTDDKIKEIYLLAIMSFNNGQKKIPVYSFPFKMTDENIRLFSASYPAHKAFWKNLKNGYDHFTANKQELKITVNSNGEYEY